MVELALILARGCQHPPNSLECREVGVGERVRARNRRVSRALLLVGAEIAGGLDVANRLWIDQRSFELQRLAWTDGVQSNPADLEIQRELTRFAGADQQP